MIIEVDGKYVMVEILWSAVPFGDVKHTVDDILCASKQQLTGYGVGQYECSFTASGNEIVLVDTVFPCAHMKVTDNDSNIKKPFKFFDRGLENLGHSQEYISLFIYIYIHTYIYIHIYIYIYIYI